MQKGGAIKPILILFSKENGGCTKQSIRVSAWSFFYRTQLDKAMKIFEQLEIKENTTN
jgi:hypothetical protein